MSRDPLRTAIERALLGPIDTDLFEECAVSLLRAEVSSLVLLPGGDDQGLDGVSREGEWGLVATTGDALSNLKKNLRTWLDKGGSTRRILFATPRSLSNLRRRNLVTAASELGFDLALGQIYEQKAFTERLYRDSAWRKDLLGVPGAPPALSEYPASLRPTIDIPMVGRGAELQRLTDTQGDILIVGAPGAGKTFLTQSLVAQGHGLFAVDFDRGRLADAIRDLLPTKIIVEDVHFVGADTFAELLHLRTELGHEFSIVSTTWPAHEDDWATLTQATTKIELEPLTRDEMVEIIGHAGVTAPNQLVRVLVDQSLGRPGLAVMLAGACRSGRVADVARGDVLMNEMAVTYRRLLDARAVDVLAVFSLAGERGAAPEEVAAALTLDLSSARQMILGLAHGGALEELRDRRLKVMPPNLRYPLVKDAFLTGSATLPLDPVLLSLDAPSSALQPLVGAAHLGAVVDRGLLEKLLAQSRDPRDFAMYATLGEPEATRSLQMAPDFRRQIALASIGVAPRFGIKLLLDDSVGDDRPRHSHPDHPMRELRDFVGSRYVDINVRRTLMDAIEEWLDDHGDHSVALEAMSLLLPPAWEGRETDPGRGMTVTLSAGLVSSRDLLVLISLMARVTSRICAMTPRSYDHFAQVIHEWCFPSILTYGKVSPERAWQQTARRAVRTAIESLGSCMPSRVGILTRLTRAARSAGIRVTTGTSAQFETLFPSDDVGSDWHAAERKQRKAAALLAQTWRQLSPMRLAGLILLHENEAQTAGLTYPRLTPAVCAEIARIAPNRLPYIRAFSKRGLSGDLLEPFLELAAANGERGVTQAIERLLQLDAYRHLSVVTTLRFDTLPERIMAKSVDSCTGAQRIALETLALRDELPIVAITRLLDHADPMVARAVAIGMRDHVPPALRTKWEDAIVRCPADDYWYSVILKREPELFGRWLVAFCIRDSQNPHTFEPVPHTLSEAIGDLTQSDRLRLLRTMPPSPHNPWLDDVIKRIVGDDACVFEELLKRDDLKPFHSDGLAGRPSEFWFAKAEVALNHGWTPEHIVGAVLFSDRGWSGDESAYWQTWLDGFEAYSKSTRGGRLRVVRTAVAQFRELRDKALEDEHREAVTGIR